MGKLVRHIGLQFFAEGGASGASGTGATNNGGGEGGTNTGAGGGATGGTGEGATQQAKTFTQEEVNRMLANEKRQGRQSVLKELGIDPEAKDGVKNAKATLDASKTAAQLSEEALNNEKAARQAAEAKALAAEQKLQVMASDCKPEFVEEVTALTLAKTNDTTDFEIALKAVKEKCPAFFTNANNDTGTGAGQGHKKQSGEKAGTLGARLANNAVNNNATKNPYFTN